MLQRDNAMFLGMPLVVPILRRQFQRDFHRGGTIVGIKNSGQRRREHAAQLSGQFFDFVVGEAGKKNMVQPCGLFRNGTQDMGMAVAVKVHPPGRDGIDDLATVFGKKTRSLGARDAQGLRIGAGNGERMPDFQRRACAHVKASRLKESVKTSLRVSRSILDSGGMRPITRVRPYCSIASSLSTSRGPMMTTPCTVRPAARKPCSDKSV